MKYIFVYINYIIINIYFNYILIRDVPTKLKIIWEEEVNNQEDF